MWPLLSVFVLLLLIGASGLSARGVTQLRESSPLQNPFQLLAPADASRTSLVIMEEGIQVLESLEGPVAVVAVVGPYHTGKSFLLNNLVRGLKARRASETDTGDKVAESEESCLNPDNTTTFGVFEVGKSVDPSTAGVWAYHQRVRLPAQEAYPSAAPRKEEEIDLLLLDTEGFAVANVSEAYDAQIFAAATVLSSVLVYNSMHLIDAKELEYLDLLAHNTQLFALKAATHSHTQASEVAVLGPSPSFGLQDVFRLPPLLWSVQAFTVDLQGESCTSWLTRLIKSTVLNGHQRRSHLAAPAEQRLGLDGLFPSVECQTLFLPATSRPSLHRLAALPPSQLSPDFLADVDSLLTRVLASLQPKTHRSSEAQEGDPAPLPLSGAGLAALLHLVVDGLNQGQLWSIPSRWSSFSSHLRLSSVRAAVSHFESEVTLGFRNATPPLPAPEMASLVRRVRREATELVPRLLVGLERGSVREAVREVEAHVRELAYKLTRSNEGQVRGFLRSTREALLAGDAADADTFQSNGLPVTSSALKDWGKAREEALGATFQAQVGPYRDEGKFVTEARELHAQSRLHTEKVREANAEALTQLLSSAESVCLTAYEASVAAALSPALPPVLPAALESFHLPALANATGACLEGGAAAAFREETKFKATVASLSKAAVAHYQGLREANSARLDAHCQAARATLLEEVRAALGMGQAGEKGIWKGKGKGKTGSADPRTATDEAALEAAVDRADALQKSYPDKVEPFGVTSECQVHARALEGEVAGLVEEAREEVAAALKAALQVPLQEICKVVVEAKCPAIYSARGLRATVQGECIKWVRRHDAVGAALSPRMLKRVLLRFIDEELGECHAQVKEREVEWRKRWVRLGMTVLVVVSATLVLMLLGAMGKLPAMVMEEGEEGERDGVMSMEGEYEKEGLSGMLGVSSPTLARRRRRSSILGLLSPYKGK